MPSEEVLLAAAERLLEAAHVHLREQTVASADAVIAARLRMKETFIEAGWVPPPAAQQSMKRDRLLLQTHAGDVEDQPLERTSLRHAPLRAIRPVFRRLIALAPEPEPAG